MYQTRSLLPDDPSALLIGYEARAASFENPAAARGAGGTANKGRKGDPARWVQPGDTVTLVDVEGPGRVGHVWLAAGTATSGPAEPRVLRRTTLEVTYDDLSGPSVSVPLPDFFGIVHGLPVPYTSALTAMHEGTGFVSRMPMPFRERLRITLTNGSDLPLLVYFQIDFLLGPLPEEAGILHATFRRENPTTPKQDFTVLDGALRGPGRYLGMVAGVRLLDGPFWWGEGEIKMYFDGEAQPTICGTGVEDYFDTAWGLGTYSAPETGCPLVLGTDPQSAVEHHALVGAYRWHLSDPVPFQESLRVTIQQLGAGYHRRGDEQAFERFAESHEPGGHSWDQVRQAEPSPHIWAGLYETTDDWCSTAFVYCREPQVVPSLDVDGAGDGIPFALGGLRAAVRPPRY